MKIVSMLKKQKLTLDFSFRYIELSSNDRTNYKARELKSIHVDAEGIFLKLIIHKNYVNPLNLYNQVSIVAINLLGDDLDKVNIFSQHERFSLFFFIC